jgi:hypothetical protein
LIDDWDEIFIIYKRLTVLAPSKRRLSSLPIDVQGARCVGLARTAATPP